MHKKKSSKTASKLLAAMLAAAMSLTLLPTTAMAVEGRAANEDLVLSKTAKLEDNGTYTIDLEAYAKGEIKITKEKVPCDIVLVLDQSGSMADPFEYEFEESYEQFRGTYWESYSTPVYHQCENGEYHELNVTREWKISGYRYQFDCDTCSQTGCCNGGYIGGNRCFLAGFTQYPSSDRNWGHLILKKTTNSTTVTRVKALKNTLESFVNSVKADAVSSGQSHRIAMVGFASETGYGENTEILSVVGQNSNYGNSPDAAVGVKYTELTDTQYRNALVDSKDSQQLLAHSIEVLAAQGATRADLGMEMAKNILAANKQDGRKQVVIMFTDGSPTSSNGFETKVANAAINHAKTIKDTGADVYTIGIYEGANGDVAIDSNTSQENTFMHAVSSNYLQATSMTDYGSLNKLGYFQAASNAGKLKEIFDAIAESVSGGTSVTLDSTAVLRDIVSDSFIVPTGASVTAKKVPYLGNNTWDEANAISIDSSNIKVDGNTIEVTGFNYAKDYVHEAESNVPAGGYKLAVTIEGVEATDKAVTNDNVNTNKEGSGIYGVNNDGSELLAGEFVSPVTKLTSKTFVLDYAKTAALDYTAAISSISHLSANDMAKFTVGQSAIRKDYGTVSLSGSTLNYAPNTMAWGGYDSFYVFGKTTDPSVTAVEANRNGNLWSKISVLPANNVYFEDTFDTISYDDHWNTNGTSAGNTETANNDVHGWIDSMANDAEYSDGTAAYSNTANSTATFTFTGTGVDVYSRTNDGTGYVKAQLSQNGKLIKSQVVNSQSVSGDYYQIPTISFSGLKHGTYTVKLTVGTNANYYLDGIRVYNPLSEAQENDSVVSVAYGDEIGATFMEVRDVLLDAKSFGTTTEGAGAVFLDKQGISYTVAEYEDYGPKNEVYLSQNQAIVFNVGDPDANYYIGLKAPGGATKATVTDGSNTKTVDINAASDLYYKVVPSSNGMIEIKNTGGNLLSITKLRRTGDASDAEVVGLLRVSDAVAYANSFDSLSNISDEDNTVTKPEKPEISKPDRPEHNKPQQKPGYHKDWFKNLFHGFGDWFRG